MASISASKDGDDFWNTSSSGFNFDDEEDISELSGENVFHPISREKSALPIYSIVSKRSLDLILASGANRIMQKEPNGDEVIRRIFLGQGHALECYKALSDKVLLLDSALQIRDGDTIMKVLFFLKSTLEQSIFHQILTRRKYAVLQLAHELSQSDHSLAVLDLYLATGYFRLTPEPYMVCSSSPHQLAIDITKPTLQIPKNIFNPTHQRLLHFQWQSQNNMAADTIVELLVFYCKSMIEKNKISRDALYEFKKYFEMDDMSFEWTVANVLASQQMWVKISDLFIKPTWYNKKTVLRTSLPPDRLVYGISRHDLPDDTLEYFLKAIPDGERAVNLARKLKFHKFVIQYHINKKDRLALIAYRNNLTPRSEEFELLENALLSVDKKWRN